MRGNPPPGPRTSRAGLAAAALSGAVAVLYLSLIVQGGVGGGDGDGPRVALFAVLFAALPVLAFVGSFRPDRKDGIRMLVAAALGMTVLGVLGIFTIGLPLLLAAACAWGAVIRSVRGGSPY